MKEVLKFDDWHHWEPLNCYAFFIECTWLNIFIQFRTLIKKVKKSQDWARVYLSFYYCHFSAHVKIVNHFGNGNWINRLTFQKFFFWTLYFEWMNSVWFWTNDEWTNLIWTVWWTTKKCVICQRLECVHWDDHGNYEVEHIFTIQFFFLSLWLINVPFNKTSIKIVQHNIYKKNDRNVLL